MKPGERYLFRKLLGAGGMGEVYLAEDRVLKREVAIKRVKGAVAEDKLFLERIERESVLHARVGMHPHIVSLFDRTEDDGEILIVMEYVPGTSLRKFVEKEGGALSVAEAVAVVGQILLALEAIHAHGIIHRDIKPENVMVMRGPNGLHAKLVDFGIARGGGEMSLTQGAGSPGTPRYMAPEQIAPEQFGPTGTSIDIYATGMMLYELLAGETPFSGTFHEVMSGHLYRTPSAPKSPRGVPIPDGLSDAILRALKKTAAERWPNAATFRTVLVPFAGEFEGTLTAPMSPVPVSAGPTMRETPAPPISYGTPPPPPQHLQTPATSPVAPTTQNPSFPMPHVDSRLPAMPAGSHTGLIVVVLTTAVVLLLGIAFGVYVSRMGNAPPQQSAVAMPTPSPSPTPAATIAPTPEPTPLPTPLPSTATATPAPAYAPSPTATPLPAETAVATDRPTPTPRPSLTPEPSPAAASPTASPAPAATGTPRPARTGRAVDIAGRIAAIGKLMKSAEKKLQDDFRDPARNKPFQAGKAALDAARAAHAAGDDAAAADRLREAEQAFEGILNPK